ncbi:hypothetical protein MF672_042755 [Actinomadura sp. ATCC 31491]|uniref:Uncharacterized protein n=1 Tax=Actinomadura luzonensis TaxID=2805427 RepID=A0ABT0G7B8_9ACTN|nr:hypothetical protein [Actinomadura luzonensis]MCK2220477.1 hypothetical protein [Actinomadura luzonensis]
MVSQLAGPVDQPAENVTALDLARRQRDHVGVVIGGSSEAEEAVWPVAIVVIGVFVQHGAKVPFAEDQQPVGAFRACGADPSLGEGVRARRSWRDLEYLNVVACEHLIEAAGELRVPIAYQELEGAGPVLQVSEKVTGLLGNPCAVRVGGDAEHVHESGADLHHKEDVQPAQRDGVHREEVTSQCARGMGAEEIAPAVVGTSRRRTQTRPFQDSADRRTADSAAQML